MNNLKYKVGDKVRIKSLDWYNKNKDDNHEIKFENGIFTTLKSTFLGQIMTIEEITLEKQYILMEDKYKTLWTDEMIEGLVEEEVFIKANDIYNEEYSKGEYCHEQSFKWGFQEGYNYSHENDKLEISLKEGYQFVDENGNVINATKIVLEKKKKEYPKTYEECCGVLGIEGGRLMFNTKDITEYEENLICKIGKLEHIIVCRDAYWKIAGEEMGLGKPWEPDWNIRGYYAIARSYGNVVKTSYYNCDLTFVFPTEEMRDAFYENFKSEIEFCKELL